MSYTAVIPIWEECSKEEYDSQDELKIGYKMEPVYHLKESGIMAQIQLIGMEPDSYRYYKKVGEKHVIVLAARDVSFWTKLVMRFQISKDIIKYGKFPRK